MPTPKLYVAVPCAHETIVSHCAVSLYQLAKVSAQRGIETNLTTISLSDIEVTRSILASHFLSDASYTHLLFVDSDMEFSAALVMRMLELGEDFVSAIYVKRELDLQRLVKHAREHPNEALETAVSRSMRYVGKIKTPPPSEGATSFQVTIRNGFIPAEQTGMGLCLISRRVLAQMVERGLVVTDGRPFEEMAWRVPYYGFFQRERAGSGAPTSEDFSFCRRWTRDCGGTIWACVDTPLGHAGHFNFTGSYIRKLRAGEV